MTLRVFGPPGAWAAGQRVTLSTDESHYLVRVRRGRPGATVELLDGEAAGWIAVLVSVDGPGRAAVLELRAPRASAFPPPVPLLLLLVVPEPRATLDALTIASEQGATEVVLIEGEHSPGGVPSSERITRTLRAAQRQCGRLSPPRVWGPTSLAQALQASADRPGWVASPPRARLSDPGERPTDGPLDARVEVDPDTGARLLIGPEGGLSAAEQALAEGAGLRPLALGPWVLRTPTAVSAGLARLWGAVREGRAQPP